MTYIMRFIVTDDNRLTTRQLPSLGEHHQRSQNLMSYGKNIFWMEELEWQLS